MKFADIDYDLAILDKYCQLTEQELQINPQTQSLDLWQKLYNEFRFCTEELSFNDRLQLIIDLAEYYFSFEYECYAKDDYLRRNTYLQHLLLARFWQGALND